MNNTAHFLAYNGTRPEWPNPRCSKKLTDERRKLRDREAKRRRAILARRELQQQILQLMIAANHQPTHINDIATQIGKSPLATLRFLRHRNDDLWIESSSNPKRWYSQLKRLPDRLFY